METQNAFAFDVNRNFIHAEIDRLTQHFMDLWQDMPSSFPEFTCRFTTRDHRQNETALQSSIRKISDEMKQKPLGLPNKETSREMMLGIAAGLARQALGFEDRHVDVILDNGFFDVAAEFARQAKIFDPTISDNDIYQAARNVMTMNFIQLLMQKPVSLTPSIFAYSLLYPLTDNYLDSGMLSTNEKMEFCGRFGERLLGLPTSPVNTKEQQIWQCICMIEREFLRDDFPLVHASLLGIYQAQVDSLQMLITNHNLEEKDLIRLIFAKGGAAVLADGYLVAGSLDEKQRLFMFAYGVFTQLIDDLEDARLDEQDGISTLFSMRDNKNQLDETTNRLFHFGIKAFGTIDYFVDPQAATLKEMIWKCIDPLLIDMASQNPTKFSTAYLRDLECHFPFSFKGLRNQRRALEKHNFQLMNLVQAFARLPDVQLGHANFLEAVRQQLEPNF